MIHAPNIWCKQHIKHCKLYQWWYSQVCKANGMDKNKFLFMLHYIRKRSPNKYNRIIKDKNLSIHILIEFFKNRYKREPEEIRSALHNDEIFMDNLM